MVCKFNCHILTRRCANTFPEQHTSRDISHEIMVCKFDCHTLTLRCANAFPEQHTSRNIYSCTQPKGAHAEQRSAWRHTHKHVDTDNYLHSRLWSDAIITTVTTFMTIWPLVHNITVCTHYTGKNEQKLHWPNRTRTLTSNDIWRLNIA